MALHLEASLQQDIDRIRGKVLEMAALGEKALNDGIKALTGKNRQMAYAVILRDQYIDELEKEVDRLCLEFIVRQQPVASVLRFVYATIKINLELERVGDYAESIARQTLKMIDMPSVKFPTERFEEIAKLSITMLHDAIRAFLDKDGELARKTIATEDAVDLLKSKLNKDLQGMFRESLIPFEALNPLVMIARRLERVSDQARNICMEALYVSTGEYAKHPGAEAFRVLFVDEHNSCRSLMAEVAATGLKHPKFIFASAGLDPQPIDQATISFMKEKGFDVSRMAPKAINQVPNLDHFHVIVALAKEVRRAFPQTPRKVVFLDWIVADPSRTQGTHAELQAAYEHTFKFINDHIKDLMDAILGDDHRNH